MTSRDSLRSSGSPEIDGPESPDAPSVASTATEKKRKPMYQRAYRKVYKSITAPRKDEDGNRIPLSRSFSFRSSKSGNLGASSTLSGKLPTAATPTPSVANPSVLDSLASPGQSTRLDQSAKLVDDMTASVTDQIGPNEPTALPPSPTEQDLAPPQVAPPEVHNMVANATRKAVLADEAAVEAAPPDPVKSLSDKPEASSIISFEEEPSARGTSLSKIEEAPERGPSMDGPPVQRPSLDEAPRQEAATEEPAQDPEPAQEANSVHEDVQEDAQADVQADEEMPAPQADSGEIENRNKRSIEAIEPLGDDPDLKRHSQVGDAPSASLSQSQSPAAAVTVPLRVKPRASQTHRTRSHRADTASQPAEAAEWQHQLQSGTTDDEFVFEAGSAEANSPNVAVDRSVADMVTAAFNNVKSQPSAEPQPAAQAERQADAPPSPAAEPSAATEDAAMRAAAAAALAASGDVSDAAALVSQPLQSHQFAMTTSSTEADVQTSHDLLAHTGAAPRDADADADEDYDDSMKLSSDLHPAVHNLVHEAVASAVTSSDINEKHLPEGDSHAQEVEFIEKDEQAVHNLVPRAVERGISGSANLGGHQDKEAHGGDGRPQTHFNQLDRMLDPSEASQAVNGAAKGGHKSEQARSQSLEADLAALSSAIEAGVEEKGSVRAALSMDESTATPVVDVVDAPDEAPSPARDTAQDAQASEAFELEEPLASQTQDADMSTSLQADEPSPMMEGENASAHVASRQWDSSAQGAQGAVEQATSPEPVQENAPEEAPEADAAEDLVDLDEPQSDLHGEPQQEQEQEQEQDAGSMSAALQGSAVVASRGVESMHAPSLAHRSGVDEAQETSQAISHESVDLEDSQPEPHSTPAEPDQSSQGPGAGEQSYVAALGTEEAPEDHPASPAHSDKSTAMDSAAVEEPAEGSGHAEEAQQSAAPMQEQDSVLEMRQDFEAGRASLVDADRLADSAQLAGQGAQGAAGDAAEVVERSGTPEVASQQTPGYGVPDEGQEASTKPPMPRADTDAREIKPASPGNVLAGKGYVAGSKGYLPREQSSNPSTAEIEVDASASAVAKSASVDLIDVGSPSASQAVEPAAPEGAQQDDPFAAPQAAASEDEGATEHPDEVSKGAVAEPEAEAEAEAEAPQASVEQSASRSVQLSEPPVDMMDLKPEASQPQLWDSMAADGGAPTTAQLDTKFAHGSVNPMQREASVADATCSSPTVQSLSEWSAADKFAGVEEADEEPAAHDVAKRDLPAHVESVYEEDSQGTEKTSGDVNPRRGLLRLGAVGVLALAVLLRRRYAD